MPELSAPIRVTWDLPTDPGRARHLWGRLVDGRVLFVEVRVQGHALGGVGGFASALAGRQGPRISVLGRADALLAVLDAVGPRAVAEMDWLVLAPFEWELSFERLAATTHRLTPTLWSDPEGVAHLGQAMGLAHTYQLSAVAVLNPPSPAVPLTPADRESTAQTWRRAREGLEARVHDLFLAEAMGMEPFSGYAGCQAAETMAHVTEDGRLWGCRTLAHDLGDLEAEPLIDLWARPERRALREALCAVPEGCGACALGAACRGGCRGLDPHMGRDRSCPRVRETSP